MPSAGLGRFARRKTQAVASTGNEAHQQPPNNNAGDGVVASPSTDVEFNDLMMLSDHQAGTTTNTTTTEPSMESSWMDFDQSGPTEDILMNNDNFESVATPTTNYDFESFGLEEMGAAETTTTTKTFEEKNVSPGFKMFSASKGGVGPKTKQGLHGGGKEEGWPKAAETARHTENVQPQDENETVPTIGVGRFANHSTNRTSTTSNTTPASGTAIATTKTTKPFTGLSVFQQNQRATAFQKRSVGEAQTRPSNTEGTSTTLVHGNNVIVRKNDPPTRPQFDPRIENNNKKTPATAMTAPLADNNTTTTGTSTINQNSRTNGAYTNHISINRHDGLFDHRTRIIPTPSSAAAGRSSHPSVPREEQRSKPLEYQEHRKPKPQPPRNPAPMILQQENSLPPKILPPSSSRPKPQEGALNRAAQNSTARTTPAGLTTPATNLHTNRVQTSKQIPTVTPGPSQTPRHVTNSSTPFSARTNEVHHVGLSGGTPDNGRLLIDGATQNGKERQATSSSSGRPPQSNHDEKLDYPSTTVLRTPKNTGIDNSRQHGTSGGGEDMLMSCEDMSFDDLHVKFLSDIRDVKDLQKTNGTALLQMQNKFATAYALALQDQSSILDLLEQIEQASDYADKVIARYQD